MNRRDLFKAGLAGSSALLLRSTSAAASSTAARILWIHCDGGWDQSMVFDPKIGEPTVAEEAGATALNINGVRITDHPNRSAVKSFFQAHGAQCVIVNGIDVGSITHEMAVRRILAGQISARLVDWVSWWGQASAAGTDFGSLNLAAPWMPGPYGHTSVRLTEQTITARLTPPSQGEAVDSAINSHVASAWAEMTRATGGLDQDKSRILQSMITSESKIASAVAEMHAAVWNNNEEQLIRHGRFAIEAMRSGVVHSAMIQAGRNLAWDTHRDNHAEQTVLWNKLFSGLTAIVSMAQAAGLADRLIIIVTSEMGRSPTLNEQGGKGHWPWTSALLWGPTLRGGSVIGGTDQHLRGLPVDPIFGDIGVQTGVKIDMANVIAALGLQQRLLARGITGDVKPLSCILGYDPVFDGANP
jgi:uncharacterized protein (DUF1501 family)